MSPSHTTGRDCAPPRKARKTAWVFRNQDIVHRRPWKSCHNFCAKARFTRQVLRAMNRNIHISGKEGTLDFCRDNPFRPARGSTTLTLSPFVATIFVSIVTSGCARRIASSTNLVCARASSLPRVPRTIFRLPALIKRRYNSDTRSEFLASEASSAVSEAGCNPREIESTKSVTCSAMIDSAAATCWRLRASDCSATDCSESMS